MKKIIVVAISVILLAGLVGCTKNKEPTNSDNPPVSSSQVTESENNDSENNTESEKENIPNERTPMQEIVKEYWKELDGFWVDKTGAYIIFFENEEGVCMLNINDQSMKVPVEITASGKKESVVIKFEDGSEIVYDSSLKADDIIKISEAYKEERAFAFAGKTTEEMIENTNNCINKASSCK